MIASFILRARIRNSGNIIDSRESDCQHLIILTTRSFYATGIKIPAQVSFIQSLKCKNNRLHRGYSIIIAIFIDILNNKILPL